MTPMEGIIDAFYREPPRKIGHGARDYATEQLRRENKMYRCELDGQFYSDAKPGNHHVCFQIMERERAGL